MGAVQGYTEAVVTAENAIAGLLLLANVSLVGLVAGQGLAGELSAYTPAPLVTLKERINQERLRMARGVQGAMPGASHPPQVPPSQVPPSQAPRPPTDRIFIAGVDGFTGDPCPALAGFLDHMDSGIREAGGEPPPVDRELLLTGTDCSVDDPAVNLALRKYRAAWVGAGLRPLYPFKFLAKK